jgi:glycosyltransferase involved in cell wall biosynthesis
MIIPCRGGKTLKRVLVISQNFYPEVGSAGNRIKNIYCLLHSKGYDVHILTTEPTYPNRTLYENAKFWDEESLNHQTDSIHRIRVTNRKYSQNMFNRLLYYMEITLKMILFIFSDKKKYDVLFVSSPPLFIGLVGLIAKYRYRGSRLILDIRDLWPESLKGVGVLNVKFILFLASLIEIVLYKRADHIVVNSKGFIEYICKKAKIKREKIKFLPNAIREYEFKQSLPLQKKKEFKVIYSGNIGLAQDINVLKKLALKLNEVNVKFSIVGYGMNKNYFIQFVKEKNLNNVEFFSPLTRKEVLDLNRQHSVGFVSLNNKSVFDTVLPGKIIDYMGCGIPLVGSISGISKNFIVDHELGFVSEKRDVNEVVENILRLAKDQPLWEKLAKNCLNQIKKDFLWEKNIDTLINLIELENEEAKMVPSESK